MKAMKSEIELINNIEAYLRGELSPEEQESFEQLRKDNPAIDHQVVSHHNLMKHIAAYGDRVQLQANMTNIHSQLDTDAIKAEVLPLESRIKTLWYKYRINAAVAASIAVLATFFTLLSTGHFTENANSTYSALRREMNKLQHSQKVLAQNINNKPAKGPSNPEEFGGTGFALSTNGYIVTNYHVVKDAESVYIQNTDGESYKVKTVYTDPVYDIAVLQITDPDFISFKSLPYTFKKLSSDLGEDVYTIGFPRDIPVYTEGYLSAKNGITQVGEIDTTAYQVDISVNPGNSGGPLLDYSGNIIGVISGKQLKSDGVSFAIKSNYLMKVIKDIPSDSLNKKLVLNRKNSLSGLNRKEQIKKMQKYIFMVKVY
jgi:serine protease Do